METTINTMQEQPLPSGQPDAPNPIQPQPEPSVQSDAPDVAQPTSSPLQAEHPGHYDATDAARIAEVLREGFDPEYVLLFGSLAGGTPHSDVAAYDLLVVTREEPYFGWPQVTRYLKYKLPPRHRDVPYANIFF